MMHLLMELWTPKPAWHELSPAARQDFVDGVLAAVQPLMTDDFVLLGSGLARNDLPYPLPCRYFAVWQAARAEQVQAFAELLVRAGWYTYFDQVNIGGLHMPLGKVLSHQVASET
jgi:hypothetical protein